MAARKSVRDDVSAQLAMAIKTSIQVWRRMNDPFKLKLLYFFKKLNEFGKSRRSDFLPLRTSYSVRPLEPDFRLGVFGVFLLKSQIDRGSSIVANSHCQ